MREKWIKVRVSEAELAAAKAAAEGYELGLSDFIRFSALGPASAARIPHHRKLEAVSEQLIRIGNNLNQSVQLAHIAKKAGTLSMSNFKSMTADAKALRREIAPYLKLLEKACGLDEGELGALGFGDVDDDRQTDAH